MSEVSELLEEFEFLGGGVSTKPGYLPALKKYDDGSVDASWALGSGVYALLWKNEIVYVGRAKTLINRIYTHINLMRRKKAGKPAIMNGSSFHKAFNFDGLKIWQCKESDLYRLEKQMINRFRPRYNIQNVPEEKLTLEQIGFDLTRIGVASVVVTPMFRRRI